MRYRVKVTLRKNRLQAGFTLLEVLVAMALFIVVLVIASKAFNRIVSQASSYSKMEESNIEGVIGLEVMRHDLAQIGFGLPWGFSKGNPAASGSTPPSTIIDSTITYSESVDSVGLSLNDASNGVPRAFASYAGIGAFASDYIGLKGSTMGNSKTAQRWAYIPYHNFSSSSGRQSRPVSYSANNLQTGDKVILINSNFNDSTNKDHRLLVAPNDDSSFYQNFSLTSMSDDFLPTDDQETYMVYGMDTVTPRMPFNRADFFIQVPGGVASTDGSTDGTLPPFCAPLTGVLYKATVNHANGRYNYIPLLDCVADMQVVLGWDWDPVNPTGTLGAVTAYSSLPVSTLNTVAAVSPASANTLINTWLFDAKGLREHLKIIKVYILAQEGKFDPNYTTPSTSIAVGPLSISENGGLSPVKTYTLSAAQTHYRWKLYRIVVRPGNLVSNQR